MIVRKVGSRSATELLWAQGSKTSLLSQKHILCSTTCMLLSAVLLGACSQSTATRDADLGVSTSPRVVSGSRSIPKGGGHYKVGKPYKVAGRWYVPRKDPSYDRRGVASWYGAAFHGRRTANGEIYDMNALTAGHPTLPLPSYAYVTNLKNGRTVLVRDNASLGGGRCQPIAITGRGSAGDSKLTSDSAGSSRCCAVAACGVQWL